MEITTQAFWKCIWILLRNYHAINRKLFACIITKVEKVNENIAQLRELDCIHENHINAAKTTLSTETELQACLENFQQTADNQLQGFIVHLKLLTKKTTQNIEAISIIDFTTQTCSYNFQELELTTKIGNCENFSIKLKNLLLEIEVKNSQTSTENSARWAEFVLKPKLIKWCDNTATAVCGAKQQTKSLQLLDAEAYNNLYKELKQKYADQLLKYWQDAKETTDPLKFIYEDLAIAAYLITLWRSKQHTTNIEPTAFADLGCGNGLLVFILNAEGYKGYGYDLRARKLWNFYPQTTSSQLIEQAITPNNFQLPAEVDWLIGNHSDELSPWLPVLAATNSYDMRYFLLPCCAYEFSGAKFQRRNTSISGYQDFYSYAEHISDKCYFETLKDRLKIPSTKRLALIGIRRLHARSQYEANRHEILHFVQQEREKYVNGINDEVKLREKEEPVRNCTHVNKQIIETLVETIFRKLLTANEQPLKHDMGWQSGGRLSMRQIVQCLTQADLKHIKSECGGIKTLLRNKREVFEFCGKDLIGIRKPLPLSERTKTSKQPMTIKKRYCFFKEHHPNGCPLSNDDCSFIH